MPPKPGGKNPKRKVNEAPPVLPDWPPLLPLVHPADLAIEELLEGQISIVRRLFTSALCKRYVSFLSSLPLTTTPSQPKEGNALRVNDRIQFDDPTFAEQLWSSTALKNLVDRPAGSEGLDAITAKNTTKLWGGEVLGLNPRIRIYRYGACPLISAVIGLHIDWIVGPGQFFGQHYDESNNLIFPGNPPVPARTTWTLLIYLTGQSTGCIGGETVFYPELGPAKKFSAKPSDGTEPIAVELEAGMALLHKHGQDCLLHEGREVVKGEKWVIRTDLCVRR